jgi:dTDP-4-amino-4,6-dideoxygalactose transaminase
MGPYQLFPEHYSSAPLHRHACYEDLGYRERDLPLREEAAGQSLALPVDSAMPRQDVEYLVQLLAEFYGNPGGDRRQ